VSPQWRRGQQNKYLEAPVLGGGNVTSDVASSSTASSVFIIGRGSECRRPTLNGYTGFGKQSVKR
jgi:hypothetical protein